MPSYTVEQFARIRLVGVRIEHGLVVMRRSFLYEKIFHRERNGEKILESEVDRFGQMLMQDAVLDR